ncbi:unnamed protein product [Medioppia subpectinata]|uniref:Cytochrome P450 n=1 Tax=Medioppia subpectinata TaxID=1979941 RepID=A0A7R9Q7I9_9ACAR|nr:unnamed protein product [Medioppia subpectinata]CAG2115773.1 unnamed protein product [Medioppia subpectinata]
MAESLILLLSYLRTRFYHLRSKLPPGPHPLPLIGNILLFKRKDHWDVVFRELAKQYGPVFTFWFFNRPQVVVTDVEMAREAFKKNDIAGRDMSYIANLLSNDKHSDVVFADYGHRWEALRRVAHSAVQKYSINERLVSVATDSVDRMVKAMLKREGVGNAFNPKDYIYLLFLNILATSAFGQSAKNDALRDGKESAPYLTDANLAMTVMDLFFAGTDTSQGTFQWLLLFICYYPEMQKKLRQEIESQIGDRMPTHEDRNRCHYVMAFIAETLRFRNVAPTGLPHKAIVNTILDKYTIPKNMSVIVYHGIICRNDKDWQNDNKFKPERFINNEGQFITTRPKAFIPFGVGRRVCPGEKLAIADLFLVLVRFLQSTQDYELVLDSHNGIEVDPNVSDTYYPCSYKISLKQT